MTCSKVAVMLSFIVSAILPGTRALAEDFASFNGAPKWNVYDYNQGGKGLRSRISSKVATGGSGFDLLFTRDTALLGTSHPNYVGDLLGDLTSKAVSARVGLTVTSGAVFSYSGEPDACGTAPSVRFYFQTNTSGEFQETNYWWSNPVSLDIGKLVSSGDATMAVSFDPSNWSDFYGHFGNDPQFAAAFQGAVKDVEFIGLSFGGGCFFENGVGIEPGTGSGIFRLLSFSVD
jgi:hypothetical protein